MMNRRKVAQEPACLGWFGDLAVTREWLMSKPWLSLWAFLKIMNATLRSFGKVSFVNNPLSGALIVIAMALSNPLVAAAAVLTSVVSVVCSKFLGANDKAIIDGDTAVNSVLVGIVCTTIMPTLLDTSLSLPAFWVSLAVVAIVTCYVDLSLNVLFTQAGLPALSLPFNVVTAVSILAAREKFLGHDFKWANNVLQDTSIIEAYENATEIYNNSTVLEAQVLDVVKILSGTVLAPGEVYGAGNFLSSGIIWLSYFLYSPVLTICGFIGSVVGALTGLAVVPKYSVAEVYVGLWSYNSLLTACCLCSFLNPSLHSFVAMLVGALMAAVLQAAIAPLFSATSLPVMSYPFNLAAMVILALGTRERSKLSLLPSRSYPEKTIYQNVACAMKERKEKIARKQIEMVLRSSDMSTSDLL